MLAKTSIFGFAAIAACAFAGGAAAGQYEFLAAPQINLSLVYRLDKLTGDVIACQFAHNPGRTDVGPGAFGVTTCYRSGDGATKQEPSEYGLIATRHEQEGGVFRVDYRTGALSICYLYFQREKQGDHEAIADQYVVCTPQWKQPAPARSGGRSATPPSARDCRPPTTVRRPCIRLTRPDSSAARIRPLRGGLKRRPCSQTMRIRFSRRRRALAEPRSPSCAYPVRAVRPPSARLRLGLSFRTAARSCELCATPTPANRSIARSSPGFSAPRSFTGEEMAEVSVTGGRAVTSAVVKALALFPGLRLAEPGEFGWRAFMNGKLDLSEVEGLADLVEAETEAQRRQAQRIAGGALSRECEAIRSSLLDAMAAVETQIDFSDVEDASDFSLESVRRAARRAIERIDRALATADAAARLREGFTVVIAGPPNVGKSTLMNALGRP